MNRRASGLLLPVTSLPSVYGIGDFGYQAFQFADFLAKSGQSYWQILPLNPTAPLYDNSPFNRGGPADEKGSAANAAIPGWLGGL